MSETTQARFVLSVHLGNDAMQSVEDVGELLERTAPLLRDGTTSGYLRDENGNTVGEWSLELDPEA